jgi:hypothetical protein
VLYILLSLNLILTIALFIRQEVLFVLNNRGDKPEKPKKLEPEKDFTETEYAEYLRVKTEAANKARQWQNFLNYDGNSQMKGGDS